MGLDASHDLLIGPASGERDPRNAEPRRPASAHRQQDEMIPSMRFRNARHVSFSNNAQIASRCFPRRPLDTKIKHLQNVLVMSPEEDQM